ncbi:MAG TPA: glycoside hydrolase family 3 C-terminal domain-containing protein [Pyrinomonadaceae bacterium]
MRLLAGAGPLLLCFFTSVFSCQNSQTAIQSDPAYKNISLTFEQRVDDLVSRMTLEEKISQMMNGATGIDRLGIPPYDWWNEALHGVARAGNATVFPQAIGLAATWNTDLMFQVADVTSTEARAKHHEFVRKGARGRYQGLTFWSPNINIFRDPRWGRGQETYGEDPYLTGRLGVAFVKGLQGNDPRYLKTVATPKHYAVHSGPEPDRHSFDAKITQRDLMETYLPAFRATIVDAGAQSVMCAYNRTNGEPCCTNKQLYDILRNQWGFKGYVVSDCGAIDDIYLRHKYLATEAQASALAVKTGTDLTCGREYRSLLQAVKEKLITEAEIDQAVKRLMLARFRLGMFDPPEMVPFARIPITENDSEAHRKLALQAARESVVLLKNENNTLPLKKDLKTIAVIGPNANSLNVLLGNYNGQPSKYVTPLEGIRTMVGQSTRLLYSLGAFAPEVPVRPGALEILKRDALKTAAEADAIVMVMGITPSVEGEELKVKVEGFNGGDRTDLALPAAQEELIKEIQGLGKPVVLVLLGGSALAVNWANEHVGAILHAWYPGEEGGTAIAEILFGDYNPAGRLPVTVYKSVTDLPAFTDYNMQGRTYRFFKGEPLYQFGFGLSYTEFKYAKLTLSSSSVTAGDAPRITVDVQNVGSMGGDEVVQLYVTDTAASFPVPIRALGGFKRVSLKPNEKQTLIFTLNPEQMAVIDDSGKRFIEPGEFLVSVGGRQPDPNRDEKRSDVLTARFMVTGERKELP